LPYILSEIYAVKLLLIPVWTEFLLVTWKSKVSRFCGSLHTVRRTAELLMSDQANVHFTCCQKYSSDAETISYTQDPVPAAVQTVPISRVTAVTL